MKIQSILIVENDRSIAHELARALSERGYRVETADTMSTALDFIGQAPPDLAIADLELPDGGGGQLRLAMREKGLSIPLIFLTDPDDDAALAAPPKEYGAAQVLARNVGAESILQTVERLGAVIDEPNPIGRPRTPSRALVIEDELDHCEMIRDCFARNGREIVEMTFAHSVQEACELLEHERFSFVLLDHNLPDGTGVDVLEMMEEQLLTTAVIGISTSSDPNVALADFRGGAMDFIEKHEAFQGNTLRRKVFEAIANHKRRVTAILLERRREQTGIDQADEQLIAAARTDSLMRILNRAAFNDLHADLHQRATAERICYAVCMIDVDNFKKFNDHYGHGAGDETLHKVAQALKSSIRPEDAIARYGGEEIVVLLAPIQAQAAQMVADRLVHSVWSMRLPHEHNAGHGRVTVSTGAAVYEPGSDESAEAILRRADEALYAAKAAGRHCAIIAAPAAADAA